jgi:uncharacterized protein (TIGR02231 family)
VEGAEEATIQEVSYKSMTELIQPDTAQADANKAKHRDLKQALEELEEEQKRLEGDLTLVEGFARQYMRSPGDACTSVPDVLHGGSLDAFQRFQQYYATASRTLSQEIIRHRRKVEEARTLLKDFEEALGTSANNNSSHVDRWTQVTVVVDAEEDMIFELTLSYVVSNASWSPRYDIRVNNDANRLTLAYMAEIRQSTDEAWEDVQMVLSTAQPSIGGDVPELDQWKVSLYKPVPIYFKSGRRRVSRKSATITMASFEAPSSAPHLSVPTPAVCISGESNDDSDLDENEEVSTRRTNNMTYEIPARATIPSDNVPHKVTGK